MILSEVGVLVRLFMSNRKIAYSVAVSNQCLDIKGRFFSFSLHSINRNLIFNVFHSRIITDNFALLLMSYIYILSLPAT